MHKHTTEGPLVVAVDSSTTSTKAIVVDAEGNVWHTAKREFPLITPAIDYYEHDARNWWTTTRDTIAEVISKLSAKDRERLAAVGLTHQRESFAPFDKDGNPLRNGILWLDGRAVDQIARYGSPEIHELSGKPAGVTPALYKMAWVKEKEPEVFPAAHKIVDVLSYLVFNLTGEWASSTAAADSLGLFNLPKFDYDDGLLEIAGVRRDQMARLVEPGKVIANVRREILDQWGVKQDIPVISGLGDGQAAGVGAAAVTPEVAYLNLGTAVNAGVESPVYKYDPVYRTLAAGTPGKYVFEVLQSSGAYLAGWFRKALGDPALDGAPDPALDEAAAQVAPGCDGLITLPYWNAVQSPHWDAVARGATVGWKGGHTRAHMYRSILESIGYEMRNNLDSVEAGTGTKLTTLRAMGGGTRSMLWRQIMADTTGLPITVCTEDEISALGAAVVAMSATGAHGTPDIATSAKAMAQFGETIDPDPSKFERYAEVAEIQKTLYGNLRETFEQLHRISE